MSESTNYVANDLQTSLMRTSEQNIKFHKALKAIDQAIMDDDMAPTQHREILRRHRAEWKNLWDAIDRAMDVFHGRA